MEAIKPGCNKIQVPASCCQLLFGPGNLNKSSDEFTTVRGEKLILQYDKNRKIIRIDLLDPATKLCQI